MSKITKPGMRLLVACTLALLGLSADLQAQQVTVRGRVVNDQTNEPLAGASVLVKGAAAAALTGSDGEFTLDVTDPDATLVVSFIGYLTAEIALNGRTSLAIRLQQDAIRLQEVVVVGYGAQKRSDVTGSVVSVSAERLEDVPNTNFAQALQGALPGVSIATTSAGAEGAGQSLLIRGRNSITASNEPLVVVDGIPYNGGISEINQNDVASIEVLKDASASAIYGARGSNGVILVTTKKGGIGKPRFSYEGYAGTQSIANMPRLMTGAEFAEFKCQRINGGENCESVYTATELKNIGEGNFTDWIDLATRTGVQQQHNLSLSGGSEDTRYYIAGSALEVRGVAENDQFQRSTLRLNVDQKVKPWLDMGTNTQMSVADRSGMPASFEDAFFMNPLATPYEEDGETLTVTPWPDDPVFSNPLQGFRVVSDDVSRRVLTTNYIEADLPFLSGLSYRINGGIDFASREVGRYYGRDTRTGADRQGYASTSNSTRFDWTLENILRYSKSLGRHNLDVTALYSNQGLNLETKSLQSEGFPNDVMTYYQAHVAALVEPSYSVTESRIVSQMGRFNYSYDSRYLLTLTARRDGFSGFGSNHKYGVFPSVAMGWNASRESFWPFRDNFNTLKLRLSYGQNGNQAISPYQTLARLRDESYVDGTLTAPGFIPSTLGNPNLKWETTTSLNFGADFGLLKNRLQGTLDVYVANTQDLLLDRAISPVHGITSITENIGKTRNRGIELQLSSVNLQKSNFTWRSDFNISANRNEIVDLYGNEQDDLLNGWFIGKPVDVNYGYTFDGIWQEGDDIGNSAQPSARPGDVRVKDLDGDGKITPEDRTFIGSLEPSYAAGLNNTLQYGDFTLSFLLHTVQGITRNNYLLGVNLVFPEVRRNALKLDYWTPENPINTYPANREGTNPLSVPFYQDASFIRLKDVTLSYSVPTSLTERLGVQSLRVYVNGRNLWTRTDWTGLDPELNSQRAIPLEKVVVSGINLGF